MSPAAFGAGLTHFCAMGRGQPGTSVNCYGRLTPLGSRGRRSPPRRAMPGRGRQPDVRPADLHCVPWSRTWGLFACLSTGDGTGRPHVPPHRAAALRAFVRDQVAGARGIDGVTRRQRGVLGMERAVGIQDGSGSRHALIGPVNAQVA